GPRLGRLGHAAGQMDGARQARRPQIARSSNSQVFVLLLLMSAAPAPQALPCHHGSDRTACSTACNVGRSAPGGTRMVAAPMTISIMGVIPPVGGGSSLPIGRPGVDVVAVGAVMTLATMGVGVRRTPLSSSRPACRGLACIDP